jgi:hypothetical protein
VPDLPIVKSRLPINLNPNLVKELADVYSDDYNDRYSVEWGQWGFLIDNSIPFAINVAEGFNGKELEDRERIVELLRIAEHIHRTSGKWPVFETEWEEMCPGGLAKLDVTSLAAPPESNALLPEVLRTLEQRLDSILKVEHLPFARAESHYARQLSGLTAFSSSIRSIQRDFDEHPVCVLNTNTKTRRLRFFEVLARFASAGVGHQKLESLILEWASSHVEQLKGHSDSKGAILESTGLRSVTPYANFAKELGVVTTVGRGVTTSNAWRALLLLVPPQDSFHLRDEERLFFLFDLLAYDRDVIWPLLIQLRDGPYKKRHLRSLFPTAFKAHLASVRRHCGTVRARRQVDDAIDRTNRWERPEVYMEHVVDPRLSWFVDLQLCQFEKDEVRLTPSGEQLASMFVEWSEHHIIPVTKEYLRWQYFKQVAPRLREQSIGKEGRPSQNQMATPLREYCDFVHQNTKSLAPNRIVASTLFRYAGVRFFLEHRIAADFRDLVKVFGDEDFSRDFPWQLRWQPAQDDGYLTRREPRN